MNAEQIEKLIEVLEVGRDAAHEVAQRFHDEMKGYREAEHKQVDRDVADIQEAIAMLQAERATQPAQDRCCEHDSDCAVHNAPAYPVGSCDCTLSEKPAKEQVAAVRAVPVYSPTDADYEGWCARHDMRKDRSDHRQMFDDAASLYLTAQAPQPQPTEAVQSQAAGTSHPTTNN